MKGDFDLELRDISKIEGHTHLGIRVRDGKVESCKMKVSESKRFFSDAAIGKKFNVLPVTMSRICGTCSSAHVLCCIEALEKALGVDKKISEQTRRLRDLLVYSNHLRDHAMHLYFFCLPDIFGMDSVFDFPKNKESWIKDGLEIKEIGNFISSIVGGRAVHPQNAVFGGFIGFPNLKDIEEAVKKLRSCRNKILKLVDIFAKDRTSFIRKTNYVGLINNNYSFLEGLIASSSGLHILESEFGKHFRKVILPYSTSYGVEWEGKEFMVGALARLNLNKKNLNANTKKDVDKYLREFPCDDVFNNNLAQAIEMLQCVDACLDIFERLIRDGIKKETPVFAKPVAGIGVGVMEAPRGTLYYEVELDSEGIVKKIDLCIPTEQNIIHMEKDIASYVEFMLKKNFSKKKISLGVEKMIRAYDPCMSCATHFLVIDWE
jgi:sulfhydrogenase subunit alpha